MHKHRIAVANLAHNLECAAENASYMLQPFGVLESAHHKLLTTAVGRAETVTHGMNVFDVEEVDLTRRIVLFALVAATRSVVGNCVLERSRVKNIQCFRFYRRRRRAWL